MWHSGTLAAAKQAVLFGCRGIALSAPTLAGDPDFDALEPFVERVLERLLPARQLSLVNVNFPEGASHGLQWTRQSVRQYDGHVVPGQDPMGRAHFWFVVKPLEPAERGTDRWAVEHGYTSMTPLRLDLTNEEELAAAQRHV
jgi:5'-nucleotidase